jgi:hypothetical protein
MQFLGGRITVTIVEIRTVVPNNDLLNELRALSQHHLCNVVIEPHADSDSFSLSVQVDSSGYDYAGIDDAVRAAINRHLKKVGYQLDPHDPERQTASSGYCMVYLIETT